MRDPRETMGPHVRKRYDAWLTMCELRRFTKQQVEQENEEYSKRGVSDLVNKLEEEGVLEAVGVGARGQRTYQLARRHPDMPAAVSAALAWRYEAWRAMRSLRSFTLADLIKTTFDVPSYRAVAGYVEQLATLGAVRRAGTVPGATTRPHVLWRVVIDQPTPPALGSETPTAEVTDG